MFWVKEVSPIRNKNSFWSKTVREWRRFNDEGEGGGGRGVARDSTVGEEGRIESGTVGIASTTFPTRARYCRDGEDVEDGEEEDELVFPFATFHESLFRSQSPPTSSQQHKRKENNHRNRGTNAASFEVGEEEEENNSNYLLATRALREAVLEPVPLRWGPPPATTPLFLRRRVVVKKTNRLGEKKQVDGGDEDEAGSAGGNGNDNDFV